MERDWDNLLLLDACRYDILEETASFGGDWKKSLSQGSESWEFMQANFVGEHHHDTVYVTANPHTYKIPDNTFYRVINLLDGDWDEKSRTVLPETVVKRTLDALNDYPNKRIITHFMQPHFPFLGPTGQKFDHEGIEIHLNDDRKSGEPNPWVGLMRGYDLDKNEVIRAYRENYHIVLPHIEELIDRLSGKTIVSADHANLLGERTLPVPIRTYGHPSGIYKRELVEVPWIEFDSANRRTVTIDQPVGRDMIEERIIKDRLQHLGYRKSPVRGTS